MNWIDIPRATYRLQFHRKFTFAQATEIVPYLAALGISHVYASPYLRARPGSMHGYDCIDHNQLNPEIGLPEEFDRLVETLHQHGMGQILDLVPNHMGVMGSDNAWWMDVLENGESSNFADFFDIDWQPLKDELQGKVLVPVLDDQYGVVLDRGDLKLDFDSDKGEFSIWYHQNRFPIDPREYPQLLSPVDATKQAAEYSPEALELQSLISSFGHLPSRTAATVEAKAERNRDKEIHKRRLAALCAQVPQIAGAIRENVHRMNGVGGDNRSLDALHDLIKAQAFRLAYWRVAADDINYRRFFDINDLAGLRTENPAVFEATHRFVMELAREGKVNGFRIDHPDGLFDPEQYFRRLRECNPSYVVIEKILSREEVLPSAWPVDGTTGYDFANLVNGLFVDRSAAAKFDRAYRGFLGERLDFREILQASKTMVMETALASELNVLANLLSRIALSNRHTCDFTVNSLREALLEVVVDFSVYRTYLTETLQSDKDRSYIGTALYSAKLRSTAQDTSVYDFIGTVLRNRAEDYVSESYRRAFLHFAMKFQQFTGPVMAKGLEDTSFFRYHPLMSLNDVGGDPQQFGVSVEEFHSRTLARASTWPHSMLATSTHDSKLSEDVRARIDVLSEMPAQWRLKARQWRALNQNKKQRVDDREAPSRNDEYLFYQILLGVWPAGVEREGVEIDTELVQRLQQYMLKAAREAKEHTSWQNQNAGYEQALLSFVEGVIAPDNRDFLNDFLAFQDEIARLGAWNALSQTLIKLTSPGVPDIYQGNELSEFRLVDPDNRQPVDYALRRKLLEDFTSLPESGHAAMARQLAEKLERGGDAYGHGKLFLTWKLLQERRNNPVLQKGDYQPLLVEGERAQQLVAYLRRDRNVSAIVIAPRMCARLLDGGKSFSDGDLWQKTQLKVGGLTPGSYRNAITEERYEIQSSDDAGSTLRLPSLMQMFPWVLLIGPV